MWPAGRGLVFGVPQYQKPCTGQKKALRLLPSLVLLLLCQGAENDSNTKHHHSSSKCLFLPPKTVSAIFNTICWSDREICLRKFRGEMGEGR